MRYEIRGHMSLDVAVTVEEDGYEEAYRKAYEILDTLNLGPVSIEARKVWVTQVRYKLVQEETDCGEENQTQEDGLGETSGPQGQGLDPSQGLECCG